MSCFLPATGLPSPSPHVSNISSDPLLHSYPNYGIDVSPCALERDYMGLRGSYDGDDRSITFDTARDVHLPPLFFNTSVLAGSNLCGSHLKLAPPGSCEDDDDGNLDDGESLSGNVGWPPVSSYRKTTTRAHAIKPECNMEGLATMIVSEDALANDASKHDDFIRMEQSANLRPIMKLMTIYHIPKASWIKVSMDGTPIMRKLNLESMQGYDHLFMELHKLFKIYKSNLSCEVGKDSYPKDVNGFCYVLTYEDKEGDWMLLGDTPWKTFTQSAKRIRIMKRVK